MSSQDTSHPASYTPVNQDDLERLSTSSRASNQTTEHDTSLNKPAIGRVKEEGDSSEESHRSSSESNFSEINPKRNYRPSKLVSSKEFLKSWGLEFGAVIVSISSIIATIVVLSIWNGQPLTKWHFVTSLNTVISTLGALSRVTLGFSISVCIAQQKWNWFRGRRDRLKMFERFDHASRGPGGSSKLLWSLWRQ
jgi:uncharacterized protein DUF3176